jgi:hypothetical protein
VNTIGTGASSFELVTRASCRSWRVDQTHLVRRKEWREYPWYRGGPFGDDAAGIDGAGSDGAGTSPIRPRGDGGHVCFRRTGGSTGTGLGIGDGGLGGPGGTSLRGPLKGKARRETDSFLAGIEHAPAPAPIGCDGCSMAGSWNKQWAHLLAGVEVEEVMIGERSGLRWRRGWQPGYFVTRGRSNGWVMITTTTWWWGGLGSSIWLTPVQDIGSVGGVDRKEF